MMTEKLFESLYTFHEVNQIALKICQQLQVGDIVVFDGQLGAGKTTLIKAIAHYLGYHQDVTSPTFSLINEYTIDDGNSIYHMDLYRVNAIQETLDFGIDEYLFSQSGYCFIEWADIIMPILPLPYYKIEIQHVDAAHRRVIFHRIISQE